MIFESRFDHVVHFENFVLNSLTISNFKDDLLKFFNEYDNLKKIKFEFDEQCKKRLEILKFIKAEIEKEKIVNLRLQNTSKLQQTEEIETLTPSQTQKIGLLIRSGIIEFLRQKNPKISNNQLAGFIQLLTKEPLKQSSINPHLKPDKENEKHPFYPSGSITEIDLLLSKYNISPQADQ